MTSTSVREQVVTAAGTYASQYPEVVDRVVSAIESGGVEQGKAVMRDTGYGSYAYLLDSVTLYPEAESTPVEVNGFDKATACEVIRAFIQTDRIGSGAYNADEVTALLQIAGLEDEPVVEPEVEDEPGVLRRLVNWAKGQGFSG